MKEDPEFINKELVHICASVQESIIVMLMDKLELASQQTGITEIAIAGGVSANSALRSTLTKTAEAKGWQAYIPAFEYCRDNAAMIGIAGYYKYLAGEFVEQDITAEARLAF